MQRIRQLPCSKLLISGSNKSGNFVFARWTIKCHKKFLWTQTLLLTILLHVFAQACSDMHLPQRQKNTSLFCTVFWVTYCTMSLKQTKKRKIKIKTEQNKTKKNLSYFVTRSFEISFLFPHRLTCDCEGKKTHII